MTQATALPTFKHIFQLN